MIATIDRRLRALEATCGIGEGGGEYPECGAIPPENNRYKFVWRNRTPGTKDEWCSWCGRPLVTVLHWE
jgi:hypothetical protein